MLNVRINKNIYELPLGDLYKKNFFEYIHDDVLELDSVTNYRVYDELFDYVAKSFTVIYGTDEGKAFFINEADEEEAFELRRRMPSLDNLQRFFVKRREEGKAIRIIRDFLVELLAFNKRIMKDYSNKMKR